jgi:hypothetical protein
MAYARFARDSDVYVYEADGEFLCMRCDLSNGREMRTALRSKMLEHLQSHQRARHKVPEDTIEQLQAEIASVGDSIGK